MTQVEYTTQKAALETVIQADHAAVVTQMKLFRSTEQVTEASIATIIGSTTGELNLWMEGKQESIQMERKYDKLIRRLLLNFGEFLTEKTGATVEKEGDAQQQEKVEETEVEEATAGEADATQHRTLRTQWRRRGGEAKGFERRQTSQQHGRLHESMYNSIGTRHGRRSD